MSKLWFTESFYIIHVSVQCDAARENPKTQEEEGEGPQAIKACYKSAQVDLLCCLIRKITVRRLP